MVRAELQPDQWGNTDERGGGQLLGSTALGCRRPGEGHTALQLITCERLDPLEGSLVSTCTGDQTVGHSGGEK